MIKSSQNSNNEFENLDDMLSDADGVQLGIDSENPFGEEGSVDNLQAESFVATDESGLEATESADGLGGTGEVAFTDPSQAEGTVEVAPEEQPVQFKKAHCWDLYSILLFFAWLALLGGIAILYFECPPSEYGNVPYKTNSVPVKATAK